MYKLWRNFGVSLWVQTDQKLMGEMGKCKGLGPQARGSQQWKAEDPLRAVLLHVTDWYPPIH